MVYGNMDLCGFGMSGNSCDAPGYACSEENSQAARMVIAGLDEAGYGPKLGPMTVAVSAFTAEKPNERELVQQALLDSPVPVRDSKLLFSPQTGLKKLELSALGLLAAAGIDTPVSAGSLITKLSAAHAENIKTIPWYESLWQTSLPLACDSGHVSETQAKCRAHFNSAGITHINFHAAVMTEKHLNGIWQREPNKARASLAAFRELTQLLIDHGKNSVHLTIDQQGGRTNYVPWLCECFPGELPKITPGAQPVYNSCGGNLCMEVMPKADSIHPEVATASIIAKYLRELMMHAFSTYWNNLGVEPADGYGGSWRGFMERARPHFKSLGIDELDLYRLH